MKVDGSDTRPSLAELIRGEVVTIMLMMIVIMVKMMIKVMIMTVSVGQDNNLDHQMKQREEKEEVVETRKGKVFSHQSHSEWPYNSMKVPIIITAIIIIVIIITMM